METRKELSSMLSRITILERDSQSMLAWRASMEENTEISRENTEILKQAIPVIRDVAGAIRTLGWFGNFLKWVAAVGGGCAAIWAGIRFGLHL